MEIFKMIFTLFCLFLLNCFYVGRCEDAVCLNNKTEKGECCQDYKNVSGTCEPCLGMWGKNCLNNCSFGFYGHGCRQKCNCSDTERCDPKEGCQKVCSSGFFGPTCQQECNCSQTQFCDEMGCIDRKQTTASDDYNGFNQTYWLVLVSIILLLLLRGIVRYILQKIKRRNSSEKSTVWATHEELSNYADVRESQFIENATGSVFKNSNSPQYSLKHINGNEGPDNPSMIPRLLHTHTSESKDYGKCDIESCDYNHIEFNRRASLPFVANALINDYDKIHFLNKSAFETYCETNVAQKRGMDDESDKRACNSCKEEHSMNCANKLIPTVRPYSSVKYNRREKMDTFS